MHAVVLKERKKSGAFILAMQCKTWSEHTVAFILAMQCKTWSEHTVAISM
jgi:hypothetical protein